MSLIGVRELRQQTTQVLRKVQEEKAEYVITYQGRPIALLLPLDTEMVNSATLSAAKQSAGDGWEIYRRVAESLRQAQRTSLDTQQLMDEIRGER
ncbi:MAG: type II toxin-antitoxin system prevent-host-death family antitoxin [Chloroflexi bacterium]|nr:type II toxin-antitoxin system prevent-host-death family antitoxin [Chloroflexota bacterium]